MASASRAHAQVTLRPTAIVSVSSGKCVNVSGGSTADVTPVIQWVCSTAANAAWTLEPYGDAFQVIASHSGKCLNVEGGSTSSGARVIQYHCTGGNNELWYLEPYSGAYRLRARHSGKCLNVFGGQTSNATQLIQWDCAGGDNELWSLDGGFVPADRPARLVSVTPSAWCADIFGASTAPGTAAIAWPCKPAPDEANQRFTLQRVNDAYRIVARHSGQCLAVASASTLDQAAVVQAICLGTTDQLWKPQRASDAFRWINANSGKCLDLSGDASGAALVQRTCSATPGQTWRVSVESSVGAWSPTVGLPLVPVAAAMLRTGAVMMWAAYDAYTFGGDHGQTVTALFDPASNTASASLVNTGHDMFCPGTAMLPNGNILVNGGSSAQKTSIYDVATSTWSAAPVMAIARGYNADTVLANGGVFTIGGSWSGGQGGKSGEVWNGSGWSVRSGLSADPMTGPDPQGVYRGDNHAWLFGTGGGLVFHAGPSANMNWFDTAGTGTTTPAGARADDPYSINGNAIMFDIGRILKVGGAPAYQNASATGGAYVIDLRSGVAVSKTGSLAYPRAFHNSVVLPDGRVLVLGGQAYPVPFTDSKAALAAELYSDATRSFTTVAAMTVPRTYHSIALLLPDARVLVGGGGLCGTSCDNNHPDVQIYSPDYLFQPSGQPAVRPAITSAPATLGYGATATVTTNVAVAQFALVRLTSVTHSTNNDQRRVPLAIAASAGTTYTLATPASSGIATPGYYMLFAIDAAGVPSVAAIVQVS